MRILKPNKDHFPGLGVSRQSVPQVHQPHRPTSARRRDSELDAAIYDGEEGQSAQDQGAAETFPFSSDDHGQKGGEEQFFSKWASWRFPHGEIGCRGNSTIMSVPLRRLLLMTAWPPKTLARSWMPSKPK